MKLIGVKFLRKKARLKKFKPIGKTEIKNCNETRRMDKKLKFF